MNARNFCIFSSDGVFGNHSHCTTVSGLTKMSASFQQDQRWPASSQKSLSAAVSFGRGCLRLRTLHCCRSAKFSVRSLLRD
jgi:hypothetical protein